jgi:hypothetical protein
MSSGSENIDAGVGLAIDGGAKARNHAPSGGPAGADNVPVP